MAGASELSAFLTLMYSDPDTVGGVTFEVGGKVCSSAILTSEGRSTRGKGQRAAENPSPHSRYEVPRALTRSLAVAISRGANSAILFPLLRSQT